MRATWLLLLLVPGCAARRTAPPVPPPAPAVRPAASPEVAAACDTIARLVDPVPGVVVSRTEGAFEDPIYQRRFDGCRVVVAGSFEALGDEPPVDVMLHDGLAAEGWSDDFDYSADGPDGTDFALRREDVFCVVEGRWEGGLFEADEPPPSDAYEIAVGCAAGADLTPPGQP